MFIYIGKNRIDCSIDFSIDDFIAAYKQGFILERLDINDGYKAYRKHYNKINPNVDVISTKKKRRKEA